MVNIIIGLLIGYYLGYLLHIQYRGPDSAKIRQHIYQTPDGQCYRLLPQPVVGPMRHRR